MLINFWTVMFQKSIHGQFVDNSWTLMFQKNGPFVLPLFRPSFFLSFSLSLFLSLSLSLLVSSSLRLFVSLTLRLMGQLTRQLMGINGENFLKHELFRNWTNEWKTKTGKTPCAWCKRLWRAFDAVQAVNSRASSGFSACHIIPLSGCIHRKAINIPFSRQEPHCDFIKCKAAATEP